MKKIVFAMAGVFFLVVLTLAAPVYAALIGTDEGDAWVQVNWDHMTSGEFYVIDGNGDVSTEYRPFSTDAQSTIIQAATEGSTTTSASLTLNTSGTTIVGGLNANGGIAVDGTNFTVSGTTGAISTLGGITADNFSVADTTGNTAIGGTLGITGATTLTGALTANGGLSMDSGVFTVADGTGAVHTSSTLDVDSTANFDSTLTAAGLATLNGGITADSGVFTVADVTGNVHTSGTLGVTGATTLTGALTANGGATLYGTAGGSGSSVAVSGNTTTITAGATANTAVVDAASARLVSQDANHSIATSNSVNAVTGSTTVAGTLGVTGVTTITSTGTANQMIVDATSSRFLSQNGSHSVVVNNTTTTVNGSEIVYGGSSIYSAATATGNRAIVDSTNARMMSSDTGAGNNQVIAQNSTGAGYTAANNSVVVDNTQTATVGINSLNYGTRVNGGMYIDGSLGVNGNIYSLNPTANATVNIANNGLAITGVTNEVTLVSDNDALTANARAELDLQPTSASLLVNTDVGDAHGISIAQTNTVLSGGTQSTSMTLNDWGATFKNDQTGGPARVTGVADGQNDYDAVNYRQLQKAYAGVASVAALAAIPPPIDGKNFSVGGGYGHYQGQDAVAMGAKARIPKTSVMLTVGTGYCDNNWATSVGAGISF